MSVQNVNHKPKIIGLTGGIASGKTTASQLFRSLNIPIIDSDEIVSELWETDQEMIKKFETEFHMSTEDPEFKKKLAQLIFHDEQKRNQLNHLVHPYVFKKIEEKKKDLEQSELIIIDMPLLYESSYQSQCDLVCVVYINQETQRNRLMARDQLSLNEAIKRIHAQMSLEIKKDRADVVFDNSTSKEDLKKQIESFIERVTHEKQ